jgi:hypothetical protein
MAVEQKLREGKPHRTALLNRVVKESAGEEAFKRRERPRLGENDGGRDLELLSERPERPSTSENIVPPGSAINAQQLPPLGFCQIEPTQRPLRRSVNLLDKLFVEEHPNHEFLKRVMAHRNKERQERKM